MKSGAFEATQGPPSYVKFVGPWAILVLYRLSKRLLSKRDFTSFLTRRAGTLNPAKNKKVLLSTGEGFNKQNVTKLRS